MLKRVSTIVAALSAWRQILLHVATRLYLCYSCLHVCEERPGNLCVQHCSTSVAATS